MDLYFRCVHAKHATVLEGVDVGCRSPLVPVPSNSYTGALYASWWQHNLCKNVDEMYPVWNYEM
jgi:hypothetical protein